MRQENKYRVEATDSFMKLKELLEARFDLKTGKEIGGSDTLSHTLSKAEEIAAAISANCGDMLKGYELAKGKVLWRGMGKRFGKNADTDIIAQLATIRNDRKPVEMGNAQHDRIHKVFSKLGLDATRKNGIFCSSNKSVAQSWGGAVYAIFLKDGWSGTVFEKSKRSYAFNDLVYAGDSAASEEEKLAEIEKVVKKLGPRKIQNAEDLKDIITRGYTDIILTGTSYIALQEEEELTTEVGKLLKLKI